MISSIIKFVHILSVVIAFGNMITGLFWSNFGLKTKDRKIIEHTLRGIIKTGRIFTFPFIMLLIISGVVSSMINGYSIFHTNWILIPLLFLIISGMLFSMKGVPAQRKMLQMASVDDKDFNFPELIKIMNNTRLYFIISFLLVLSSLIMMIIQLPN